MKRNNAKKKKTFFYLKVSSKKHFLQEHFLQKQKINKRTKETSLSAHIIYSVSSGSAQAIFFK